MSLEGATALLVVVGDDAVVEAEDSFLIKPGTLGLDEEAGRCPILVGELVLAIEPLLMNDPGRSPNLGKVNRKSSPLPLPV